MNLLLYEIKEKNSRKYIFLIYFAMLLILAVYHVAQFRLEPLTYLQNFQGIQKSVLVVLVCMTFLSYEVFCDFQKREWRELLVLNRSGLLKTVLVKDLLFILLILLEFIVVLAIELLKLMMNMENPQLVLPNLVRVLVLNYLILPAAGVMIGKVAALLARKRWSGYLSILVILLLICGLFERINMALYMTVGINLDPVFRFFQFEQPNSRWVVDFLYLVPAENYRFFLFGTWIAGCWVFVCLVCLKKKAVRLAGVGVCALLCLFFGVQTANPGNYVNYNMNFGSAVNKKTEFEDDAAVRERKADFVVENIRMDLHISDELEAEAILVLGQENPEVYRFTLYRGYQITEITDENGEVLDYERQKDYVTVYAPENIAEIHMAYHGYQQSFYSNQFGLMLPGYFAYYPQPGFRQVFWNEIVQTYLYYGFNTEETSLQEIDYEIKVTYDKPVYSNLEKKNDVFWGRTVAPTLMGGLAAEEFREGSHYVYPLMADPSGISMTELKESLDSYCEILGIDPAPFDSLNHMIVVPSSVYIDNFWGESVLAGDCLFLGTDQMSYEDMDELSLEIIKLYMDVRGERVILLNVLMSFLQRAIYLYDLEPMEEKEFFSVAYDAEDTLSEEYWDLLFEFVQDRMFLTLVERYGTADVCRKTAEYLMDVDATENSAEFMQRLYLELEE